MQPRYRKDVRSVMVQKCLKQILSSLNECRRDNKGHIRVRRDVCVRGKVGTTASPKRSDCHHELCVKQQSTPVCQGTSES